jgi:hypothetical protein
VNWLLESRHRISHIDRQTDRHTQREADGQTDGQTQERQTQTQRQTDRQTDRQTHTKVNWLESPAAWHRMSHIDRTRTLSMGCKRERKRE